MVPLSGLTRMLAGKTLHLFGNSFPLWFRGTFLFAEGYWPGLTQGWNKSAGREATSTDLPINASKRVFALALGSLDPPRVRAWLQTLATRPTN